jgi:hypothetical protein
MRDWSFQETEREVRANLVYREFTRIGAGAVVVRKNCVQILRGILANCSRTVPDIVFLH